jgi:hypothetical protein
MFDPMFGGNGRVIKAIWTTVSGWVVTLRARRRMKKSLGRSATNLELASLKTWMKVEEREQQEKESGAIHPR